MLARTHTFTIEGLLTRHVTVELDVRPGLPAFTIVGLADAAVREARERIHAAIRNCGYTFPAQRITANLAPGDVPKAGPGLDLALACAVLAASGQLPRERLAHVALFGELALDGKVRPVRGALAIAHATLRAGMPTLALAPASAREALLVDGLEVAAVGHLQSAVRVLGGGAGDPLPAGATPATGCRADDPLGEPGGKTPEPDLSEVRGQHHAVRTLLIAAAGAHNLLLSGSPGTGKTMLVQRLPSILPPLSKAEALEVARIHSLTSTRVGGLEERRPFRAPHHSVTAAGLIGGAERTPGGTGGRVGEVVLAHRGVLFLDELSEFSRASLEALRQPLEDGRLAIARARHSAVYPARFMLIAATNPCPCGYGGEVDSCRCSEAELARHGRRLSGPLLDRIDLLATLQRDTSPDDRAPALIDSAQAREQVREARERQAARLCGEAVAVNAHMDVRLLHLHARLDERGQEILRGARERGLLSARGEDRVLRVARTIADLRGGERVGARDLGAALALRPDVVIANNRAA
jgi:magnesium chelatase family protein